MSHSSPIGASSPKQSEEPLDRLPQEHEVVSTFKLKGNIGTVGLLFTVLAFTAPLGAVFGFVSYNISFGIAVPIAFLAAMGLMALFAVGFIEMARKIPRAGAFYTYIAAGLGRPMGLGGSFLALNTYGFNVACAYVFSGIAVNNLVTSFVGNSTVPWWIWSLAMLLIVGILTYFNIELSARVLSVVLVIEVIGILIFNAVVLVNGGPEGYSTEPWNPANLVTPSLGLLLLFCVGLFNGFESTAIYRDEVRDPNRTIPRATYLAIIFLGIFYAISSYALITAAGVSEAVAEAKANPAEMMPNALIVYIGQVANQVIAVLLVTSMFASVLSLQNILARYTHSLGVDGIFPRRVGSVHSSHGSPFIASVVVSVTLLIVIVALVLTGLSEFLIYGAAVGVAFYGLLLLLFLTSIAVVVYFRRNHPDASVWRTVACPVLSAVGIGIALLTASLNLELLIVAPPAVVWILLAVSYAVTALGVVVAVNLKRRGSPTYARIGRRME